MCTAGIGVSFAGVYGGKGSKLVLSVRNPTVSATASVVARAGA